MQDLDRPPLGAHEACAEAIEAAGGLWVMVESFLGRRTLFGGKE